MRSRFAIQLKGAAVAYQLDELQKKQLQQAEELLFSGPQGENFARELYFGRFLERAILPYPRLSPGEQAVGDAAVGDVRRFCDEHIDAAEIDRQADIPRDVVLGLGRIGVLGATIPREFGGAGMSQQNYCRVMEVLGGHCSATAVFVNAHHSIGVRSVLMFGNDRQKERWLRPLCSGEQIAAFALTEPEAGSDAANVQTRATPSTDGKGWVLNGQKRYITNGAIAGVLAVMARTPDSGAPEGKVTSFLVTPDMPGFEVVEARMPKCGIRGTATARLAFHDMFVPPENVLGPLGKGLRQALTLLDFGRTTFGASCTGAAKTCLAKAIEYANTRKQFGRTLGEFGLVQQKIAYASAHTFAMESATYHTAALIDRGAEDYMLETAMLKVFASEELWKIVNDTLQIHGGAGYFSDQPFERMMRDARINMIGEGANDVLRCFIAGVGLRYLGQEMLEIRAHPWRIAKLRRPLPAIPVVHGRLQPVVAVLSRQIAKLARACQIALFRYREEVVNRQFVLARLGDVATELFIGSCVYSRLASLLTHGNHDPDGVARDVHSGMLYLRLAARRNAQRLAELSDNDDDDVERTAQALLRQASH
ncbi:MAG: acyl-CoA dehydrogenase family protein [Planctomycetaceae bacterium]